MLHRPLMKIRTICIRKARYCPALPVENTLSDIQVVNYIVIVGIAKLSVIAKTDEQAMLERSHLKLKTRHKKDLETIPGVGSNEVKCYLMGSVSD